MAISLEIDPIFRQTHMLYGETGLLGCSQQHNCNGEFAKEVNSLASHSSGHFYPSLDHKMAVGFGRYSSTMEQPWDYGSPLGNWRNSGKMSP